MNNKVSRFCKIIQFSQPQRKKHLKLLLNQEKNFFRIRYIIGIFLLIGQELLPSMIWILKTSIWNILREKKAVSVRVWSTLNSVKFFYNRIPSWFRNDRRRRRHFCARLNLKKVKQQLDPKPSIFWHHRLVKQFKK